MASYQSKGESGASLRLAYGVCFLYFKTLRTNGLKKAKLQKEIAEKHNICMQCKSSK